MTLIRSFCAGIVVVLSLGVAFAQQSSFVGVWKGSVSATGDIIITISSVSNDGQVQGKMEFPGQSYTSTFAGKADREKKTNLGMVRGSALVIDTAPGGRYELTLEGDRLSGTYSRGVAIQGSRAIDKQPVSFRKS